MVTCRATKSLVTLVVAGLVAAGCSSSSPSPSSGGSAAPAGLPAFYSVPAGVARDAPGTLLKYAAVPAPGVQSTAYRVMYVSSDVHDHAQAVTGIVYVPSAPPPAGGYDIVSWAHGTTGMADRCAPSLDPSTAVEGSTAVLNQLLAHGWEVTASDYQGEGTPPHLLPYLVGSLSARNTIDIVRAAAHLPAAHAGTTYLVWGHSEGGQTAMFSWDIGPSYGAGLHLVGVVAGAPPSQFAFIYNALLTSPFRFYLLMAAGGFNSAYGDRAAPLGAVLTAKGMSLLPELRKGCYSYLQATLDKYPLQQLVKGDPFKVPAWQKLLAANDPEDLNAPNGVPLLIYQGGADEQIPVISTQILAAHLCGIGQDLERWIYPGRTHGSVIPVAAPDFVHWMADRFSGVANPDPYYPTGQADVQTTTCPE